MATWRVIAAALEDNRKLNLACSARAAHEAAPVFVRKAGRQRNSSFGNFDDRRYLELTAGSESIGTHKIFVWLASARGCYPSTQAKGVIVPRNKKAAVFVRCTEEEAERIRHSARQERRTVSGFVLNAVFNRIAMRDRLLAEQEQIKTRGSVHEN